MSQQNKANETQLHSLLAMCALFEEVRDKCVLASKAMIGACDETEEKGDSSVNLSKLVEKRGQMIRFLEGLQLRILESASSEWETEREDAIAAQRLDHFNRGVIRWSLEMENLESVLQSKIEKLQGDTRTQLSEAFKRGKQHKGYNLTDVR